VQVRRRKRRESACRPRTVRPGFLTWNHSPAPHLTCTDFARVPKAVDAVRQWTTLDDYLSAATDVTADVLGGDVFASAVIALANRTGEWQGTATELLAAVVTPDPRPKELPKDATRASGRLKRLVTALRAVGIGVTETRSTEGNRTRLYRIEQRIGRSSREIQNPASEAPAGSVRCRA
jgi:hypothetical protein